MVDHIYKKFNILCFMRDHYNGKLPDSIISLFSFVGDNAGHGHDLRNQGDYYIGPHSVIYTHTYVYIAFYFHAFPFFW